MKRTDKFNIDLLVSCLPFGALEYHKRKDFGLEPLVVATHTRNQSQLVETTLLLEVLAWSICQLTGLDEIAWAILIYAYKTEIFQIKLLETKRSNYRRQRHYIKKFKTGKQNYQSEKIIWLKNI